MVGVLVVSFLVSAKWCMVQTTLRLPTVHWGRFLSDNTNQLSSLHLLSFCFGRCIVFLFLVNIATSIFYIVNVNWLYYALSWKDYLLTIIMKVKANWFLKKKNIFTVWSAKMFICLIFPSMYPCWLSPIPFLVQSAQWIKSVPSCYTNKTTWCLQNHVFIVQLA